MRVGTKKGIGSAAARETNVTPRQTQVEIPLSECGTQETHWFDLISENDRVAEDGKLKVTLEPYNVVWLKASDGSKG